MRRALKSDADAIIARIDEIKREPWLSESQRWWPDYLFHFTEIHNAVGLLTSGVLLARSELESQKQSFVDIASAEVISKTAPQYKDYVRLYFRPRTPTQYCNEGFRPVGQRRLNSHCPIPIVFLFDSKKTLTRKEAFFSKGNLGAGTPTGSSSDFFKLLPFKKVYHNGAFPEHERRTIVFHRNAETIIPKSLDLSDLRHIFCRSQAEYETLVRLLPWKILKKWKGVIRIDNKSLLFFRHWTFVTKASLSISEITLHFNPSIQTPGPFNANLKIEEVKTKTIYEWGDKKFNAKDSVTFNLSNLSKPEHYKISFFLDNHLAYQNIYLDESEIPF